MMDVPQPRKSESRAIRDLKALGIFLGCIGLIAKTVVDHDLWVQNHVPAKKDGQEQVAGPAPTTATTLKSYPNSVPCTASEAKVLPEDASFPNDIQYLRQTSRDLFGIAVGTEFKVVSASAACKNVFEVFTDTVRHPATLKTPQTEYDLCFTLFDPDWFHNAKVDPEPMEVACAVL